MSERRASMGDKVYRGDVVKFIRNSINLGTFMKRTVKKADEACWDLCDKLNFVPAIEEAQPEREKGKWIEQDDGWDGVYYECSCCKEAFTLIDGTPSDNLYNFCPNCGADMREEGDHE